MSGPHDDFLTDDAAAFVRDRQDKSGDQWYYTPDGERKTLSDDGDGAVRVCKHEWNQTWETAAAGCCDVKYRPPCGAPFKYCPYCGLEIEVVE